MLFFIGILGGIGMLYFRDLMPGQAGSATTLYTNTSRVGWIIAGSVAGIVAGSRIITLCSGLR